MHIIGLTGGIASGKSHVADVLRGLGAHVADADAISRALTAPGGLALPLIRARFGDAVFQGDVLNRRALGTLVFTDADARTALEGILHPMIFAELSAQLGAWAAEGVAIAVVEMPLLYETGYDAQVNAVWVTAVSPDAQRARLMARDHLTSAEANARIASQWPPVDKAARADLVIDTSGSLEATEAIVTQAWQALIRKVGTPHGSTAGAAPHP